MPPNLAELLDRIEEVCPIPETAQRVIALIEDPHAQIRRIAETIAIDAALAAEVMRVANSAAYGRMRRVAAIEEAVVMIGLAELRDIVAAMAMIAAFRADTEVDLNLHVRALVSGCIARRIAREVGLPPGTAFVCGLLCDIGAMACLAVDGREYLALWRSAQLPHEREKLELAQYGATSREIGARLLSRNGLPQEITVAIAGEPTREASGLTRVTQFARAATPALCVATDTGAVESLPSVLHEIAQEWMVDFSPDRLCAMCIEATAQAQQSLPIAR